MLLFYIPDIYYALQDISYAIPGIKFLIKELCNI